MSAEREEIQIALAQVEAEMDKLDEKRKTAYSRERQAIDEEYNELKLDQLKLREQLAELEKKAAS